MLRHIRRGRNGSNADVVDTEALARIRLRFSISSCIRFILSFCFRVCSSKARHRSISLRLLSCNFFNIIAVLGGAIGVFFIVVVVDVVVDGDEDDDNVVEEGEKDEDEGGVETVTILLGDDTVVVVVVFGDDARFNLCPYRSSCESGGGPSRIMGISGGGGVETGVSGEPEREPPNGDTSLTGEDTTSPIPPPPVCLVNGFLPNVGDSTLHPC